MMNSSRTILEKSMVGKKQLHNQKFQNNDKNHVNSNINAKAEY